MAKKDEAKQDKANCRICTYAGVENNFMCYCSIRKRLVAVGNQICVPFKRR